MQIGDLLVAIASSTGSGNRPAIPAGWEPVMYTPRINVAIATFIRRVETGAETATGFTLANAVAVACYRDTARYLTIGGINVEQGISPGNQARWPALVVMASTTTLPVMSRAQSPADAWIILTGAIAGGLSTFDAAPSGYVNRAVGTPSGYRSVIHDSNSDKYGESSQPLSNSLGTGAAYCCQTIELIADGPLIASGSRPVLPFGQQVIG